MSLVLDKRQRAMLREMGVRVWQPAPTAVLASAPELLSAAQAVSATPAQPAAPPTAVSIAAQEPPALGAASAPASGGGTAAGGWQGGMLRSLYPGAGEDAPRAAGRARWLLLVETTAAGLQADPLQGESGVLLSNMLRAAHLQDGASVWLATLARQSAPVAPAPALSGTLAAWVAEVQPDVVLVMGRLAAQALLPSSEPFGKLRGQVHRLHGAAVVVTYDASYLLRTPADKARAWDDLCLALQHVSAAA